MEDTEDTSVVPTEDADSSEDAEDTSVAPTEEDTDTEAVDSVSDTVDSVSEAVDSDSDSDVRDSTECTFSRRERADALFLSIYLCVICSITEQHDQYIYFDKI